MRDNVPRLQSGVSPACERLERCQYSAAADTVKKRRDTSEDTFRAAQLDRMFTPDFYRDDILLC